ncbi:hypothetical protein F5146DRAFT_102495 [Armillaria mellea]|nr:hypothetical protein F5146DRAFT_102495 [Armillaria mellea]
MGREDCPHLFDVLWLKGAESRRKTDSLSLAFLGLQYLKPPLASLTCGEVTYPFACDYIYSAILPHISFATLHSFRTLSLYAYGHHHLSPIHFIHITHCMHSLANYSIFFSRTHCFTLFFNLSFILFPLSSSPTSLAFITRQFHIFFGLLRLDTSLLYLTSAISHRHSIAFPFTAHYTFNLLLIFLKSSVAHRPVALAFLNKQINLSSLRYLAV